MIKKIFFSLTCVVALAACTEDYKNWSAPASIDQPGAVTFSDGAVTTTGVAVNLNTATEDSVQVVNITTAPKASDAAYAPVYTINLGESVYNVDAQGRMAAADLQEYVAKTFGRNPNTLNTFNATLDMWVSNGSTKVKTATSDPFQIQAYAKAPVIEQKYYITGNINGWDNGNKDYELTNDGQDPYTNPTFTCRIPVTDKDGNALTKIEFKVTPESKISTGDWSGCLGAAEAKGKFEYENKGGNFEIEVEENAKFYDLTFKMLEQAWEAKAVKFDPYIYFIGATDGWNASDQKLASPKGDGKYTGYCYVADPNGWGLAFKFQTVAGSWDNEINAGTFTTMEGVSGDNSDNNIEVAAEGVYFFEVDLVEKSITATKIDYMGVTGDYCGWNEGVEMTWNATDFCYELTGAGVTANGWKFRANGKTDPDWKINLGGSLEDLTNGGANLSAVGGTIKLYPTRKTNDNIYCTVE